MSTSGKRSHHKKTRTGCSTCKMRKIKCDEETPCRNCTKHGVECDFLTTLSREQTQSYLGNDFDISRSLANNDLPELNIRDLELLHHYLTSTSQSMWTDPVVKIFWQIKAPSIGLSYNFVMRGILSMSALHLAYLHREKTDLYIPYSMQHQHLALLEVMAILPNVTADNCAALHLFSILNCCHTLGRPRQPDDFLVVGDSGIPQWLVLFRAVPEILLPFQDAMDQGPLSALLRIRHRRQKQRELRISQFQGEFLGDLRRLVLGNTPDKTCRQIYSDNIDELEKSFMFIYSSTTPVHEMGDVFNYLIISSHEYLLLLKEGTQEALVIFAYACVLFNKVEFYWWMEGWSTHLMGNIWGFLDEEHKEWVSWPAKEIGWSPA